MQVGALVLLAGCASGPTVDDAQELLEGGDPDGALAAVRDSERKPLDAATQTRARRIAFEASLALGYTEEAAHEFLLLRLPARDRERLRERLVGGTLRIALDGGDAGRRALVALELPLASGYPRFLALADRALADREPIVRQLALESIARLPDANVALPRLVAALADPDEDVRETAAGCLAARVDVPRTDEPAELTAARAQLLAVSPGALVPRGTSPTPMLERASGLPPATLDRRAAWLAADRLQPQTVEALHTTLAEGDPGLAPDAARLLAERGGSAAVPALAAVLDDGRSPARAQAARSLGALGGPDAVAALLRALAGDDPEVRRAAAEGLARSANASVLDDLSRAIAERRGDSDLAAAAAVLAIEARTGGSVASTTATTQEGP